jgi:hypothetical protein
MDVVKEKAIDTNPSNRDPITKEPGSHPVGTGVGATGGAAAGAAIGGAVAGPAGALAGGVVGAVSGAAFGHGVGEGVNPTVEDAYWRGNYKTRPYYNGADYSEYEPAYRYGWEAAGNPAYKGREFEQAEPDLERDWSKYRGTARLEWPDARAATRDAWIKIRGK